MYAIRSYYVLVLDSTNITISSNNFHDLKTGLSVGRSEYVAVTFSRITSYNVCYTKLLRDRFPGAAGGDAHGLVVVNSIEQGADPDLPSCQ